MDCLTQRIHNRIREICILRGLDMGTLSITLGQPRSFLAYKMETQQEIGLTTIRDICRITDISISDFFHNDPLDVPALRIRSSMLHAVPKGSEELFWDMMGHMDDALMQGLLAWYQAYILADAPLSKALP